MYYRLWKMVCDSGFHQADKTVEIILIQG